MRQGALLRLEGQLGAPGFVDWILHRARVLDLKGSVTRDGPNRISITVTGPAALIDAMEVACSLGPVDVSVDRIERLEAPLGSAQDFRIC